MVAVRSLTLRFEVFAAQVGSPEAIARVATGDLFEYLTLTQSNVRTSPHPMLIEVIFYAIIHDALRHQRTMKMARRRCAVYHE